MENMHRDSIKDFPAPATHNIVLVSNTKPMKMAAAPGYWDGNNVAFLGEVISEWNVFTPETFAARLEQLCRTHKVELADITVDSRVA